LGECRGDGERHRRGREFNLRSFSEEQIISMDVGMNVSGRRQLFSSQNRRRALQCGAAIRRREFEAAFRLIYDRYRGEGLTQWNPHGLRILPHQLLDTSWVLLARKRHRLLGTLSLIEDGAMGLPIEQLYPAEIWRLRREGKRVAELACFALADESSSESMSVLRTLLRAACSIAAEQHVEELVICVHPRRASFYERRLGFVELGPTRACPWVCGQPAVALRMAVGTSDQAAAVIAHSEQPLAAMPASMHRELRRSDRAYFLRLLQSELAVPSTRRIAA
jgi:hypothetical protein